MEVANVITLDYMQVPMKIIFKGISGKKKGYKVIPSADKCGISIIKDE